MTPGHGLLALAGLVAFVKIAERLDDRKNPEFFTAGGTVHPIRGTEGYHDSEDDKPGKGAIWQQSPSAYAGREPPKVEPKDWYFKPKEKAAHDAWGRRFTEHSLAVRDAIDAGKPVPKRAVIGDHNNLPFWEHHRKQTAGRAIDIQTRINRYSQREDSSLKKATAAFKAKRREEGNRLMGIATRAGKMRSKLEDQKAQESTGSGPRRKTAAYAGPIHVGGYRSDHA